MMTVFSDMLIQFTAILWLKEFIAQSGSLMLAFASGILTAVMPCLAYDDEARRSILSNKKCNLEKLAAV
jgi:vacuole morphology and inheritance protein 14